MQAWEGLGQSLVVAGEAAKAGEPAEGAFDNPHSGQEDEAALGLGRFDDLKGDLV